MFSHFHILVLQNHFCLANFGVWLQGNWTGNEKLANLFAEGLEEQMNILLWPPKKEKPSKKWEFCNLHRWWLKVGEISLLQLAD